MRIISLIIFLLSFNCYSQFKVTYQDIQKKYEPLISEDSFIETKEINEFQSAIFCFSKKDSILLNVTYKHLNFYTEKDFLDLANELISNYSPVKKRSWENWDLIYDKKNKMIIVKVFDNHFKEKIKEISFINDVKTVEMMLRLFDAKWSD